MADYLSILRQYWGYDSFRGIQREIIESIGSGKDTLGLMPTGGGKSVTFQVPALAKEGMCLVITPLIALMKDQVQHLRDKGILALAIYSGMSRSEINTTLDNALFGDYKFLYVSPERLETDLFRERLTRMKISMITVDESHCISQWGYDFRPSYLRIAEVRDLMPGVPVLALTATATPEVVDDIQRQLHFRQENVFRMSFERTNLAYIVRQVDDKQGELLHILRSVGGSAIVYVRNRKRTKEVAEMLTESEVSATYYHAGLDNVERDIRQMRWQHDEVRVMVATNAFGMGIDKPDVRLVIHLDLPDSVEAYFQEAGRAGRDGRKSYAVLLYNKKDITNLHRRVSESFPEKDYIRDVYEKLQYYYQMAMGDGLGRVKEFSLDDFCLKFRLFPVQVDSALKLLTLAGYLQYTEEQRRASRLMFTLRRDDLYRLHHLSDEADRLIQVTLRAYSGLFSDYAYIDEALLALRANLTHDQVYHIFRNLSQQHVVSYIPGKSTPYIIYARERVEKERLFFPPAVYEDRKDRMSRRIDAMVAYAQDEVNCRSRLLLSYFGEGNARFCGQCDVCVNKRRHLHGKDVRQMVLTLLQGGPTSVHDLCMLTNKKREQVADVLQQLLDEELISLQDGIVTLISL
ncbi:MAG: RecQ family ATP-dependent DNA helicase [Bacteroidaceae bacterium]|nr:RecQ family ATP-dependent DNA helicase [Bacteroidaceae bacterium]